MNRLKFSNGDEIDAIGLGTWKSEPGEVYQAVRDAIKIGYRHIDCAWIYFNEAEIGNAIKDAIAAGDVKREDLWITSKLWNSFHAKEDVEKGLNETLTALQLEYLDLYLIHWPVAIKPGQVFPDSAEGFIPIKEMPVHRTWQAMEVAVDKGLVRHIGVSNFNVLKLKKLKQTARIQPEMNQVESHPLLAQPELLEYCQNNNILFTAYSPLGSRDRGPEMKNGEEPDLFTNPTIKMIALAHDVHPAEILIKWAEGRGTAVIPKSVNLDRMKKNLEAADIVLSDDDKIALARLDMDYRYINAKFFEFEGGFYTANWIWEQ